MLLFICAAAALHLVGALILIIAWWRAPEGYEDGTEFHFVETPEPEAQEVPPDYMLTSAYRGTR
jgi:hypothetical protein